MDEIKKIPVILDTDIGDDIDDTWALAMLLKRPELDLKLVVSDTGNTIYRAKIIARMLEIAGRSDVPIGIGLRQEDEVGPQQPWVENYDLAGYPGEVYEDGVDALIRALMDSPEPVTLLCIGPVPNIAEALRREPGIARRARFVGMHGSVRKGYAGGSTISAEYNVATDTADCQAVFAAPWEMTITPVDTCGLVVLDGEDYGRVLESPDPLARAVIENYRIWDKDGEMSKTKSSILFDTVAVYLVFSEELLVMERLGIRVTDDGYTLIDENAKIINCATGWKDLAAFRKFLVDTLVA